MDLYIRTIQAVSHLNICHEHLPEMDCSKPRFLEFIWNYWMADHNYNVTSEIHAGDWISTDNHGNVLTVNGKEYVHTY